MRRTSKSCTFCDHNCYNSHVSKVTTIADRPASIVERSAKPPFCFPFSLSNKSVALFSSTQPPVALTQCYRSCFSAPSVPSQRDQGFLCSAISRHLNLNTHGDCLAAIPSSVQIVLQRLPPGPSQLRVWLRLSAPSYANTLREALCGVWGVLPWNTWISWVFAVTPPVMRR